MRDPSASMKPATYLADTLGRLGETVLVGKFADSRVLFDSYVSRDRRRLGGNGRPAEAKATNDQPHLAACAGLEAQIERLGGFAFLGFTIRKGFIFPVSFGGAALRQSRWEGAFQAAGRLPINSTRPA